jgi:hypothetical protein
MYACQPNRTFQPVDRIGFYRNHRIEPLIPRLIAEPRTMRLDVNSSDAEVARISRILVEHSTRLDGASFEVFMLSGPEDPETLRLDAPIENDKTDRNGQLCAYTQNQCYVSSDRLRSARRTSDLT